METMISQIHFSRPVTLHKPPQQFAKFVQIAYCKAVKAFSSVPVVAIRVTCCQIDILVA
jgi:hypothetical protein